MPNEDAMKKDHILDLGGMLSDRNLITDLSGISALDFENSDEKFSKFSRLYSFATENIAGYYPCLHFEKSSVLAVGGSLDHSINAYLLGADAVIAFDINVLAGMFCNLKLAAIEKLSFEAFKKFFLRNDGTNKEALDFKIYARLRENLEEPTRVFFDKIYSDFGNIGSYLRNSSVFNIAYDNDDLKIKSNLYLQSSESFEKARQALRGNKTIWIHSSLQELPKKIDKKFDIVLLSNIIDYAKSAYKGEDYLENFCKHEIEPLKGFLNSKGIICAAYIYDVRKKPQKGAKYRTDVDNPERRRQVFQSLGMDYRELYFESVIPDRKDAVILLQRR
jgi:hypothetical protein